MKQLNPITISLSGEETFLVARLITVERLDLEEQYTGTMEWTRDMLDTSAGQVSEEQVVKLLNDLNKARLEGLANIEMLKQIETRIWGIIANGN